jgi:transcriptional regulator with XRE-family HTH domain
VIDTSRIGKKIQEQRKLVGLTQEQLGMSLGVTAQAVSRWENGDSAPDIGLVPDLCRVLKMSSDILLGISKDNYKVIGEFLDAEGNRYRFTDGGPIGLRCSFCGKHQNDVKRVIAGPGCCICNECAMLVYKMMSEPDVKAEP